MLESGAWPTVGECLRRPTQTFQEWQSYEAYSQSTAEIRQFLIQKGRNKFFDAERVAIETLSKFRNGGFGGESLAINFSEETLEFRESWSTF